MRLALIPARGGSKRIPRKNIRAFDGKPIIAYSIEAAFLSRCFDEVIVSTDDAEIARVAEKYGASVPFIRPENISDDFATTADVVKHCLNWYESNGKPVSYVCCIYATNPFLNSRDIVDAYRRLSDSGDASYAFSITSFPFPVQRGLLLEKERVGALYPEHANTRSQDLPEVYHDAGQFYWGRASAYLEDVPLFSSSSIGVEIPRYRVQDIDTLEDWERAEVMHKVLREMGG